MILTLKNIYNEVVCKLRANNIEAPQLEAQIILEYVTNLKLEKIYTNPDKKIYSKKINFIRRLTKRIIGGEPIPILILLKFSVCKLLIILLRPLCPPEPPFSLNLILPRGRSLSSTIINI